MRFLVDLYRWLILLVLAFGLIGGVWLGTALMFGPLATAPQRITYIAIAVGVAVTTILGLGVTATFISIHDRLADIADALNRAADRDRGSL
ncbi:MULTISPECIES: hypothetical protein [unclassified Sphingomonas]|uniref:hypothetical protein n=1 Tax=unclassified Sphingomonas TaxID=196159 RepID=UPI0006FFBC67|nr:MULTISPECIES: hypothetical protein [unclassified Sphingomonas]KQM27922.1 hypothetical protein ASE58_06195 [Sphingomonas sp. Leaf9]KQM44261.1 hypothetical protein ASE57_06190 [Sphingomonas sp. Leaf11]